MGRLRWLEKLALPLALFMSIEIWIRIASPPELTIVPPSAWLLGAADVVTDASFASSLGTTLLEITAALLIGSLIGFGMGLIMFRYRLVNQVWQPYLLALYANPVIVLYPMAVLIFGLGPQSIIAIVVPMTVPPIAVGTVIGLSSISRTIHDLGAALRCDWRQRTFRLRLPAAAPIIFGGVNVALVYAVIGVVASEFILANAGLGFEIRTAYAEFRTQRLYALITIVIVLSGAIGLLSSTLERRIRSDLDR